MSVMPVSADMGDVIEVGEYSIVPPFPGAATLPSSYLLDTNVLIDIRNFYFGHGNMRKGATDRERLRELLEHLAVGRRRIVPNVNWGFSAQEACSPRRSLAYDRLTYRKTLHAAERVFSWNQSQVRNAFLNRHPPINRDKSRIRNQALTRPELMLDVMGASYGALLKGCEIHNRRSGARKSANVAVGAFAEFLDWMIDELGTVMAYELRVAAILFGGNSKAYGNARRLLKLSGDEDRDGLADKAWNAAWDLWLIRVSDGLSAGLILGDEPQLETWVVTRNFDLAWIRSGSRLGAVITTDQQFVDAFAEIRLESRSESLQDKLYGTMLDRLPRLLDPVRRRRTPEMQLRQALDATKRVELAVGATPISNRMAREC